MLRDSHFTWLLFRLRLPSPSPARASSVNMPSPSPASAGSARVSPVWRSMRLELPRGEGGCIYQSQACLAEQSFGSWTANESQDNDNTPTLRREPSAGCGVASRRRYLPALRPAASHRSQMSRVRRVVCTLLRPAVWCGGRDVSITHRGHRLCESDGPARTD